MTLALVNAAKNAVCRAELRSSEQATSITDPSGGSQLRIVSAPTGSGGTLVAGSLRLDFPRDRGPAACLLPLPVTSRSHWIACFPYQAKVRRLITERKLLRP